MTPNQRALSKRPPSVGLADLLTRNGYRVPDNALDAVYIARALMKHGRDVGWVESFRSATGRSSEQQKV